MSGFPILDLILGMTFVYFMLSVISSSGVEIIVSLFGLRARVLEEWLLGMFNKEIKQEDGSVVTLGQSIMDHCITTVYAKKGKATSYIDAKNFTTALLEKVTFDPKNPDFIAVTLNDIILQLKQSLAVDGTPLISTELRRSLLAAAIEAQAEYNITVTKTLTELQIFRKKVEHWYDSNMDRLEGQLKRKYLRPLTFWFGVVVVLALNADSVAISRYLYTNPDVRAKIAAQASAIGSDTSIRGRLNGIVAGADTTVQGKVMVQDILTQQLALKEELTKMHDDVPLGWRQKDLDNIKMYPKTILPKAAGWIATILAIMLGAPFWFELLNKVANLRAAGPKPASSTDAERKDTGADDIVNK